MANDNQYSYTLQYQLEGKEMEEDCVINKDVFYPYGEVKEGMKTRGEFGFMQILKVFETPHIKYGKFIAKSIPYEEMQV